MPLVIAVLVIIVLIINARDSRKNIDRRSSLYAKDCRKTNAVLEQKIMDMYMKYGYSADEAFRKSYEDMVAAGYEPCIPRNAYRPNSSYCGDECSFAPEKYDSHLIRDRRKDITEEWRQNHPGEDIQKYREKIDKLVYQKFPRNENEYAYDIKRRAKRAQAEPVGTFIIYPELGTCEILSHNWLGDGAYGGTYTLRVLKTGEVVTYVKIGDNKIQRQG